MAVSTTRRKPHTCRECGGRTAKPRAKRCRDCHHAWVRACGPRAGVRVWCRHCHAKPPNRARGLCRTCFYSPGVRDLYPPVSKAGEAGAAGHVQIPEPAGLPPAVPTDTRPGTPERIAVLADRAARGEALSHPQDAGVRTRYARRLDAGGYVCHEPGVG